MTRERRFKVTLEEGAQKDIDEARAWRDANGINVETLEAEVNQTIDWLEVTPAMGPPVPRASRPGIRKTLLRRTGYYLYYYIEADRAEVVVIAFRHVRRRPVKL